MDGSKVSQEKEEIILEVIEKLYDGCCTPCMEDVHMSLIGLLEYYGSVVK